MCCIVVYLVCYIFEVHFGCRDIKWSQRPEITIAADHGVFSINTNKCMRTVVIITRIIAEICFKTTILKVIEWKQV